MNLVAKEFLASQDGGSAPLFLSRHTGTAMTMEGLSLIDPADPALSARIVAQGLAMDRRIRESRNRQALADLREHNVYRWMAENLVGPLSSTRNEGTALFARLA
jgi:trehalose-6-phosphate synthase